jgi:hypothetical protein
MRQVLFSSAIAALVLAGCGKENGSGNVTVGPPAAPVPDAAAANACVAPADVWQGEGRSVFIQAECAHGSNTGDCQGCNEGSQLGTTLENSDTTVGFFDGGDYLMYRSIDFTGVNTLSVRYATQSTGELRFSIDAVDGMSIATWAPLPTGSWTTFVNGAVSIQPVTGTHDLYLVGVDGTEGIANFDYLVAGACVPDCSGKACGSDGCGGTCGACEEDRFYCSSAGQCEPCVPECNGKSCGDDSCGGTCGECGAGEVCQADRTCGAYSALGGPPRLHVEGATIRDPVGATKILRGVSLIDVGSQHVIRTGVPDMLDRLTAPGWNTQIVRLPVYLSGQPYLFSLTDPVAREAYMTDLLRPAVDYATRKGLYVIIDFHEISNVTERKDAETLAFWRYMARQFDDYPNVIYEVFNEPIRVDNCEFADSCWAPFKALADRWVALIRQAAPDTLVLVGGPSWSQVIGPAAQNPIADTNVAYVGHIYPFHMGSPFVETQIRRAAAVHPVILTEWGYGFDATDRTLDKEPYVSVVKAMADELGMGFTAWVADHDWGPPMFTDESGTALTDFGQFARDWLAEGLAPAPIPGDAGIQADAGAADASVQ